MDCHHHSHQKAAASACGHSHSRFDWLLWGSLLLVAVGYIAHIIGDTGIASLNSYGHASFELMNKMWWGIALGVFFVGLLGRVPREFVLKVLGKGGTFNGILRACLGGVFLDLCSHGVLLIGMKLYERGASIGQVMAFLIASPWNSLSLTVIMIALMGWMWTFIFMGLSMVIAIISGVIFERLVARGTLPANPHIATLPESFRFFPEARKQLALVDWKPSLAAAMLREGMRDSKMVLRWVFFGVVLAALLRAFMPDEQFATYFGATVGGLALTILAATIIEVCSEGSTPIAADLLSRADAPGNSFAFLMTGVSTDYTEIMGLRETTRSWKIALFLPLVTLPQIIVLAWLLNQ